LIFLSNRVKFFYQRKLIKGDKGERIVSKRLASGPNSLAALGLKNPTAIVGIVSQQFSSPTGAIVIFLTGVIA
jgi:hypothetical protein